MITSEEELRIMQLAAISTASLQNTESTVKDRIGPENPYCTCAYLDVCVAIDREMALRKERDELKRQNAELKEKNVAWALGIEQSNTDIVDMQRDEFRRIIAITDNSEIKGICERAIAVIEQTVPVVVQRDNLQCQNAALVECMNVKDEAMTTPQQQAEALARRAAAFYWNRTNMHPEVLKLTDRLLEHIPLAELLAVAQASESVRKEGIPTSPASEDLHSALTALRAKLPKERT